MVFYSFLDELSPSDDETFGNSRTGASSTDGMSSVWSQSTRASTHCSSSMGSSDHSAVGHLRGQSSNTEQSNAGYHTFPYSQDPAIKTEEDLLDMAVCLDTSLFALKDDDDCDHSEIYGDGGDGSREYDFGQREDEEDDDDDQQLNAGKSPVIEQAFNFRHQLDDNEEKDIVVEKRSSFTHSSSADNHSAIASAISAITPALAQARQTSNRSLRATASTDEFDNIRYVPTPYVYEQSKMEDDDKDDEEQIATRNVFVKKCRVIFSNGTTDTVFVAPGCKRKDKKEADSSHGLMAIVASDESVTRESRDLETNDAYDESVKDHSDNDTRSLNEDEDKEDRTQKSQKREQWVVLKRSLENIFSKQNMRETTMAYASMFAPQVPLPRSEPIHPGVVTARSTSGERLEAPLDDGQAAATTTSDAAITTTTAATTTPENNISPSRPKLFRSRSLRVVKKVFRRDSSRKATAGTG